MLKKRIIPCLDIKNGRTVKGVMFNNLKDAGDPVELSKKYVQEGADELVYLDITATHEKRKTLYSLVEKIAYHINIPFTIGGGINAISDVENLINCGADKVSINSGAIKNPSLIKSVATTFGSQCVVIAIDTKLVNDEWLVFTNGGRIKTSIATMEWATKVQNFGAGEILLTSMNNDGQKSGFALDITNQVSNIVNIPVIASGGAGLKSDFKDVFVNTRATGALAASVFHYDEIKITDLKNYLSQNNIPVRK